MQMIFCGVRRMQIPFLAWLFQGIPETIAVTTLVYALSQGEILWKKILPVGLLLGIISYIIRLMPFTPGVHTILIITALSLLLNILARIEFKKAAIFSAIAIAFLIIFEFVFYGLLMQLNVVTFEEMNSNLKLRILVSYPQVLVLFLLAILVRVKRLDKIYKNWMTKRILERQEQ